MEVGAVHETDAFSHEGDADRLPSGGWHHRDDHPAVCVPSVLLEGVVVLGEKKPQLRPCLFLSQLADFGTIDPAQPCGVSQARRIVSCKKAIAVGGEHNGVAENPCRRKRNKQEGKHRGVWCSGCGWGFVLEEGKEGYPVQLPPSVDHTPCVLCYGRG